MEPTTAIVWGVLLVAYSPAAPEMPPITDVNYTNMEQCETVKDGFLAQYPNYYAYCIQTWKPDEMKKAVARKKTVRRSSTVRRTASRPVQRYVRRR